MKENTNQIIVSDEYDRTYFVRYNESKEVIFLNFHCGTCIDQNFFEDSTNSERLLEIYHNLTYGKKSPGGKYLRKAVEVYIKCFICYK